MAQPEQIRTTQPFRNDQPSQRFPYESELWDDLANAIYYAADVTLTFTMPIAGRAEIVATGKLAALSALVINIDGTPWPITATAAAGTTAIAVAAPDLTPGSHTITITSAAAITDPQIVVRRGRVG